MRLDPRAVATAGQAAMPHAPPVAASSAIDAPVAVASEVGLAIDDPAAAPDQERRRRSGTAAAPIAAGLADPAPAKAARLARATARAAPVGRSAARTPTAAAAVVDSELTATTASVARS